MRYDPLRPPEPRRWLALKEEAQIELVAHYHRKHRIRVPNLLLHAAIHATVESQVAAGVELPVAAAIDRLVSEGLDRHEAIHAWRLRSQLSTGGQERYDGLSVPARRQILTLYDEVLTADPYGIEAKALLLHR